MGSFVRSVQHRQLPQHQGIPHTRISTRHQHIPGTWRAREVPVEHQRQQGLDDPRPFSDFWPGTVGLESVAITSYNRAYSTPAHQYSLSFYDGFYDAYTQVAALTDLPIWVAETGTTSYGTDKPAWLRQMFTSIALDFPRVMEVTFFMLNKVNEDVYTDWDLNTWEEVDGFMEGFRTLRALTS
eukprot:TRINITY_DN23109_c0_g1_i1.p1 TRINITY_DN23109_c0_g1~~TRINITY_DN23109_c0_g1_i1.p1  ORF type:complete len:183 (-),score=21.34 TRINITY_DN23109_c0_g1_i1:592-1140(-)